MLRFITRLILLLALLAVADAPVRAQILTTHESPGVINVDSVRRAFDRGPYFGLYKDNYFIFGPPIGQKITRENTNIKFQISIAQKLTRSTLPFGTYLYLFYSQKVFWNVLQNSMPMTDLNFNPGIGLCKPLFIKDRYIGKITLALEHESNGRDSIWSRSTERLSIGGNIIIDNNISVHGKFWLSYVDGVNNKDLLKYAGIYQTGVTYTSTNRRWVASCILVKRKNWKLDFNTILEFSYKFGNNQNQYLFFQYYNGYGEGMLDYKQFHSQLRVGIVIKPALFSDY